VIKKQIEPFSIRLLSKLLIVIVLSFGASAFWVINNLLGETIKTPLIVFGALGMLTVVNFFILNMYTTNWANTPSMTFEEWNKSQTQITEE
jgi:hypothetical protein